MPLFHELEEDVGLLGFYVDIPELIKLRVAQRNSIDGLQALTRHAMGHDPLDGSLYVFVSRRGALPRCEFYTLIAADFVFGERHVNRR